MAAATGGYTFSQQPRAVQGNRTKYRPQDPDKTNIMWDKRIIRGNTYAAELILPSTADEEGRPSSEQGNSRLVRMRARERAKRARARLFGTTAQQKDMDPTPSHEYLEELPAPVHKLTANETFFDGNLDEPDTVQFAPKPRGRDVQTFVGAMDLFDFDMSVEPLLETLVGKSMDQSMQEVLQEEQTKATKRHRVRMGQERGATFAEAQRLESELERGKAEVRRRLAQSGSAQEEARLDSKAQSAKEMAREYFEMLQETVLSRLSEAGHFYDPVASQVESAFMPWVVEKVARGLANVQSMRDSADSALEGAVALGMKQIAEKQEADRVAAEAEAERLRLETEERERIEKELAEQKYREEVAARLAAEKAKEDEGDAGEGDEEAE